MLTDADVATAQAAAAPPLPASPAAPAAEPVNLTAMAHSLWSEVRGLAHDQLELLSLEAQMAGQALARLLMLGAAMGVLIAATWMGGLLAGGLWLWEQGLRASSIVLIALLLNAAALAALAAGMRRARRAMGFTQSLLALQPTSPQDAP